MLPNPPRELVEWVSDELLLVVDDFDVVELELLPRKPELVLPPLLLVDWLGAQAGEPGNAGPQFCMAGPR